MRDIPSCFGGKDVPACIAGNGVQVADFSSSSTDGSSPQTSVSYVYECQIRGRTCLITITWSKNSMCQGLSVGVDDYTSQSICKVDTKPWAFFKLKGSKRLKVRSAKIDIYWDLSPAKFGSGPEPLEGFYLVIASNRKTILLLGDMKKEAIKKTGATLVPSNAVFIGKKEHIFGKKIFSTNAQFSANGLLHKLAIECDTSGVNEPCLVVRVDTETVMEVKRLPWNFRGNQTILVDDLAIEVFWDVHNWLFGKSQGNAVFMFKTCLLAEKLSASQPHSDPDTLACSWPQKFRNSQSQSLGFSLLLNAWKNE